MKIKREFQWKYDPHCSESGKGALFTSTWKLNLFILLFVVVVKVLKFARNQIICKVADFKGLYKRLNFAPFPPSVLNSWSFIIFGDCFRFRCFSPSFTNRCSCTYITNFHREAHLYSNNFVVPTTIFEKKNLDTFALYILKKFIPNFFFFKLHEKGFCYKQYKFSFLPSIPTSHKVTVGNEVTQHMTSYFFGLNSN